MPLHSMQLKAPVGKFRVTSLEKVSKPLSHGGFSSTLRGERHVDGDFDTLPKAIEFMDSPNVQRTRGDILIHDDEGKCRAVRSLSCC